jgi:GTP1/Obg family GTP-binding protein
MFLNRLNILEAQIHTWGNGIAIDTFWVEDATKDIERRLQQFKNDLEEILSGKAQLKELLSKRKESNGIKQKVIPRVLEEVKVNNLDDIDRVKSAIEEKLNRRETTINVLDTRAILEGILSLYMGEDLVKSCGLG